MPTNFSHCPARARLRSLALETKMARSRRHHARAMAETTSEAPDTKIDAVTSATTLTPAQVIGREATVARSRTTNGDIVIKRLQTEQGASIARLMEATGWQAHSVRGFLSAVVRKKRGLTLILEIGPDGERRYRIDASTGVVA